MSEHMSAAEYRKLMSKESNDGAMSDEEFQQALKPEKKYYSRYSHPLATTKNKKISNELVVGKKPRNDEEDQITIQVAEYCELLMVQKKIQCYSHIPQETFTKSWVTKNKNKAMGVRAGVPDMLIVFPHCVLFLELKRLKGGVVSEAQKAWIDAINRIEDTTTYAQGHSQVVAKVACGFDEAKTAIDNLMV